MFQTFPNMTPGSSPHVRGAHFWCVGGIHYEGIIPACAGSTCVCRGRRGPNRDHPRMCGEHAWPQDSLGRLSGSSPHVRGARRAGTAIVPACGIIPACAGSTHATTMRWLTSSGSSPHVRGAQSWHTTRCARLGIIPACAGSTIVCRLIFRSIRDHPRMCGEHA